MCLIKHWITLATEKPCYGNWYRLESHHKIGLSSNFPVWSLMVSVISHHQNSNYFKLENFHICNKITNTNHQKSKLELKLIMASNAINCPSSTHEELQSSVDCLQPVRLENWKFQNLLTQITNNKTRKYCVHYFVIVLSL